MKDKEMDELLLNRFFSTDGKAAKKKWTRKFFVIMLVITIFISVLNWGLISQWGDISIRRLTISGPDGANSSGLIYIPSNASDETPAPLVICFHGNAGNARNHESWAIEFARRGFVVVSPDLYGSGDSLYFDEGLDGFVPFIVNTEQWYKLASELPFVDKDNIFTSGHSLGGPVALNVGAKYNVKGIALASPVGPGLGMLLRNDPRCAEYDAAVEAYNGNIIVCMGEPESTPEKLIENYTTYLHYRKGFETSTLELDKLYGSFEKGNAFYVTMESKRVHEAAFVNGETISDIVGFIQDAAGDSVTNYINAENRVWRIKDYVGLLGIFAFGLMVAAFALLLIEEIPAFAEVKRPVPRNIGLRGPGMAISIILAIVFPYIVCKTNGLGLGTLLGFPANVRPNALQGVPGFRLTYANIGFSIIVGLNLLGILGFILYYFTEGKKNKLTLNDLGLTPYESNKISIRMVAKTILVAAISIAFGWAYLQLYENICGTALYAWFFGFKAIPIIKVRYYWWYLIIWILCFIMASFTINVERRLPTTGKESLDTILAMIFNVIVAAFSLIVIISVRWILDSNGAGTTYAFWNFGTDIARIWGMPAGMAVGVGGSTLLYRKTGNTWLSAFLMGTVACLECLTFMQLRTHF